MIEKYVLAEDGRTVVPCEDLHAWAWFMEHANRHIAQTYVTPTLRVSTIFLGLDHQYGEGPPLVFETMVFEGPGYTDIACSRYATYAEAEVGHAEYVAQFTLAAEGAAHVDPSPDR